MNLFELFATIKLDGSEYEKGLGKASDMTQSVGGKIGGALGAAAKVGAAALGAASTAAVGFAKTSIDAGMSFDSSMSQVAATMGISMEEMAETVGSTDTSFGHFEGTLRDFAQYMGANTAFSASQAADALNYMALAGYDAQTSMDMLPNVLNLAAAGSMDLASASDMITDSQSALGLSLDETSELVDKMAKASSKSNTSVSQLGNAILAVGGTAKDLSGGTTELATALGILADNGIKGAEGGTALRNIMLALIPKSEKAAEAYEQMGISAYDADGNLKPLSETFSAFASKMSDMSTQERQGFLRSIFNSFDLKSANALLAAAGDEIGAVSVALEESGVAWDNYAASASAAQGIEISGQDIIADIAGFIQSMTEAGKTGTEQAEILREEFGLSAEDASTAVSVYGEAVANVSNRFDELSGYIDDAQGAAQQMADTQLDNLAGDITIMKSAFEGVQIAVSDELTPAFRDFVQLGTQGLSDLSVAIKEKGLAGAMDALGPFIDNAIAMLIEGLPKVLEFGAKFLVSIVEGIINNLPKLAEGAEQLIITLSQYVEENVPKMVETAGELLVNFGNYLREKIPQLIPAATDMIGKLALYLTEPGTIAALINAAGNLIIAIIEGLINALPKLMEYAPQIVANLVVGLVAGIPKLVEVGVDLIGGLIIGVTEAIAGLIMAIPRLFMGIIDAVKSLFGIHSPSTVFSNIGKNLIQGLINGLTGAVSGVITAIRNLGSRMLSAVQGFPSQFITVGKNIATGLINGVTSMASRAINSVKTFAGNLVNAARSRLDEHSPSKVFADIGGNMALGLVEGWEDEYRSVRKSITDGLSFSPVSAPVSAIPATAGAYGGSPGILGAGGYGDSGPIQIVVQSILDGRKIGESVTTYQRGMRRAQGT